MATYTQDPQYQAYLEQIARKRGQPHTPTRRSLFEPISEAENTPPAGYAPATEGRETMAMETGRAQQMMGGVDTSYNSVLSELANMGRWREQVAQPVLAAMPNPMQQRLAQLQERLAQRGNDTAASAIGGVLGSMAGRGGGIASAAPPKGAVQQTTANMAKQFGWSGAEWDALSNLIQRESGWNATAQNPTSSAYGLFQFLDSTRKNYGISRNAPLEAQIKAGLQYIKDRYGSPSKALAHWLAKKPINGKNVGHWY